MHDGRCRTAYIVGSVCTLMSDSHRTPEVSLSLCSSAFRPKRSSGAPLPMAQPGCSALCRHRHMPNQHRGERTLSEPCFPSPFDGCTLPWMSSDADARLWFGPQDVGKRGTTTGEDQVRDFRCSSLRLFGLLSTAYIYSCYCCAAVAAHEIVTCVLSHDSAQCRQAMRDKSHDPSTGGCRAAVVPACRRAALRSAPKTRLPAHGHHALERVRQRAMPTHAAPLSLQRLTCAGRVTKAQAVGAHAHGNHSHVLPLQTSVGRAHACGSETRISCSGRT